MVREGMYVDHVARGITLLDSNIQNWRAAMDWDDLNMESTFNCVLGQLGRALVGPYSGFMTMVDKLDIFDEAPYYGFDISKVDYESEDSTLAFFWELQAEWKRQVQA